MINKNGHIALTKKTSTEDDLDFKFLRKKGIEYLQKYSGNLWTDYNTHDPGVTLLEILCYAINDLAYRINLPIEDLLAGKSYKHQFLTAAYVLPVSPVTLNDYRKLFINIPGVENAWLIQAERKIWIKCEEKNELVQKSIKGFYKAIVDVDETHKDKDGVLKDSIKEKVTREYHRNRNLCENLISVEAVETFNVQVCANITLHPDADEEYVDVLIYKAIEDYLCPPVKTYTLENMFDKGYSSTQIFDGPLLCNGFIDDTELQRSQLKSEVRLSDIVRLIMSIEGVDKISDIQISDCNSENEAEVDSWMVCIPEGKKPVMCEKSSLKYYKGLLPVGINVSKREEYRLKLELLEQQEKDAIQAEDINPPKGNIYPIGEYTTIQEHLPEVYGISSYGLPANASTEQKSKAKQLKAYLLHFEQILSAYFKELEQVKSVLAIDSDFKKTHFHQAVQDLKDIEELTAKDYHVLIDELNTKANENTSERRNQLVDHLLSRFSERFGDYAFAIKSVYPDMSYTELLEKKILPAKFNFLKKYPRFSGTAAQAMNIYGKSFILDHNLQSLIEAEAKESCKEGLIKKAFPQNDNGIWNTINVSGFQKKMSQLLGLTGLKRKTFLQEDTIENGFFLLENSLLLPEEQNGPFKIIHYQEKDKDGIDEHRWRILSEDGKLLLSSSKHYHDEKEVRKELYKVLKLATDKTSMKTYKNKNGKFYFNLVNTSEKEGTESYIIARSQKYFKTEDELNTYKEHIRDGLNLTIGEEGYFKVCCDTIETLDDPYSYKVTLIFPGFSQLFFNMSFRRYVDNLIRKEIPAHILPRICFVGEQDFKAFQNAWKVFLTDKINQNMEGIKESTLNLLTVMNKLNNVYEEGVLHSCKDDENELGNKIILGSTNLGKQNT
jgi:hypothetical protein